MNALEFFLSQHTRLHSAGVGQVEGGSFADRVFGGLPDDQMRRRPAKGMNSLAWLLWHLRVPKTPSSTSWSERASRC